MADKIIFCGTPQIAATILKTLTDDSRFIIVGVISQPDRPVGRKKEILPSPVKQMTQELKIPILQPEKIGDALEEIKGLQADYMVTCAYGQFVPEKILQLFKNCINIHASLLPKYRGGSPIQYALLNGDAKTGISLMKMVRKMDAGEVYVQESLQIDPNDNAGDLFNKLAKLGCTMVKKYLPDIFAGTLKGIAQNENEVTFAYNMVGEQERINWNDSAKDIHNFVRAMTPQPVPYTLFMGERWKIGKTRLQKEDEVFPMVLKVFRPGEIVRVDKEGIWVWTGQGLIKILELQRPGKKMLSAGTYFNQSVFSLGKMFE